jgi:hypothetical protein
MLRPVVAGAVAATPRDPFVQLGDAVSDSSPNLVERWTIPRQTPFVQRRCAEVEVARGLSGIYKTLFLRLNGPDIRSGHGFSFARIPLRARGRDKALSRRCVTKQIREKL